MGGTFGGVTAERVRKTEYRKHIINSTRTPLQYTSALRVGGNGGGGRFSRSERSAGRQIYSRRAMCSYYFPSSVLRHVVVIIMRTAQNVNE